MDETVKSSQISACSTPPDQRQSFWQFGDVPLIGCELPIWHQSPIFVGDESDRQHQRRRGFLQELGRSRRFDLQFLDEPYSKINCRSRWSGLSERWRSRRRETW